MTAQLPEPHQNCQHVSIVVENGTTLEISERGAQAWLVTRRETVVYCNRSVFFEVHWVLEFRVRDAKEKKKIKKQTTTLHFHTKLCYVTLFLYLSLYTHRHPIKGERSMASGSSVQPRTKHVSNYR